MPRRMAYFDFADPAIAPQALSVTLSAIGGFILLTSGILFLVILVRGMRAPSANAAPYQFSLAVHQPATVPVALNSHGLWVALMIGLTITNYGYPILSLAARSDTSVPAVYVGAQ
jgi:cytochrome c oxidase subunit 1